MEKTYNLDAEQQVLACFFVDDPAVAEALQQLESEDFGDARHKLICEAVQRVIKQHQVPSYVTVLDELERHHQLDAIGGITYLLQLKQSYVTTAQLQSNVEVIKEYALKRSLNRFGMELQCKCQEGSAKSLELLEFFKKGLQKLESKQQVKLKSKDELYMEVYQELEDGKENPESTKGLTTGFTNLDAVLHGLRKKNYIVLGARPSMGKTALALNIAEAASRNGGKEPKSVLFVTLEMSDDEILKRMVSANSAIEANKLHESGSLSDGERAASNYVLDNLYKGSIEIAEKHGCTLAGLRQLCYSVKRDKGLDFLLVDYLGLMTGDPKKDKYTLVSELSQGLKGLALELDIPVLVLSQLNRGVESRANKEPMMSDLRDSGTIEQDADVVLLLYRDDFYNSHNSKTPNIAKLIVSKNRNGATGEVELFFDRKRNRFLELQEE